MYSNTSLFYIILLAYAIPVVVGLVVWAQSVIREWPHVVGIVFWPLMAAFYALRYVWLLSTVESRANRILEWLEDDRNNRIAVLGRPLEGCRYELRGSAPLKMDQMAIRRATFDLVIDDMSNDYEDVCGNRLLRHMKYNRSRGGVDA